MITSLDKITVNTPEEFLNAVIEGYTVLNITITFDEQELYNYFCENKNVSHYHMYIYGSLLLNGIGVEASYEQALIYSKKASDLGNAAASNNVGYIYGTGKGVEKDLNIAFEYYKRAANLGYPGAYRNLGVFYERGYSVAKNFDKALEYYKKSEELGYLQAIVDQGVIFFKLKEYEKALSYYERAANLGIEESYFRLAYLLSNENLINPDYEKAVNYYQLLAEKKNPSAMNNLGILYDRGKGVKRNLEKAFELFKEATENGGAAIEFSNLANCYFYGKGTEKDFQKAFEACLKSCELGGDSKVFQMLYQCYNEGLGTDKDVEKAKHYRDLALGSDDIQIVIESCLDYIKDSREQLDKFKLTSKAEIVNKLQEIVERFSKSDGFFESYLLAEIYYCLYKIQPEKWKENNGNALLYAKKVYEDGRDLANHKTMQRMYGYDFFDFNIDNDYVCFDESKFDGYTIGTTRVTYVPRIEAKSNNYSIDYWLPRARLIYAIYCEIENKPGLNKFYENAISVEPLNEEISYKNVVYPNALYMNAVRYIMGYDMEINEEYGLYLLKLAGERYHSRGAYLYGKQCELKGDYDNALNFYRIAYSKVYPETVKRKESLPSVLLKPGEKITYVHYYEFGGEKKPCYEALEQIILNYQGFTRVSNSSELYRVFEDYLNSDYKSPRINEICEAFEKYSISDCYARFIEKNLDIISSPKAFESLLKANKKENAIAVLDNILNSGSLESIKNAKMIAAHYGIYTEVESKLTQKLIELGDMDTIAVELIKNISDFNNIPNKLFDLAKEKNQIAVNFFNENYEKSNNVLMLGVEAKAEKCLEVYSYQLIKNGEYEKAKNINPDIASHHIWGYLLYYKNYDALDAKLQEVIRLLKLPTELDEKETVRELSNIINPKSPRKLEKAEVDAVISYANNTKEYFKSGILLLSQNVMDGFLLLTKHYMSNTDNLLKLCDIVLSLEGSFIDKNIFSFNKAMCLYQKGGFFNKNKAKSILNDLVTLKHLSKLERTYTKPYRAAVDFLDGKEVNEEYLLNIRSKNG